MAYYTFGGAYQSPLSQQSLGGGSGTYTQSPTGLTPLGGQPPDDDEQRRARGAPPMQTTQATGAPQTNAGPFGRPGAPAPTFAEMAAQGRARPAPPPGMYGGGTAGVDRSTQGLLMQTLAQPSTYDSAAVQQSYQRLAQNIDDEFAQNQTGLREEMTRRGLTDSSIQGGRLADLNVSKRSAKEELATQLLDRQAQTAAQDRLSAITAALGYTGQQSSQAIARGQLALSTELGRGNLGLDAQRVAQQGQQFQQTFGEGQRQFDAQQALSRQLGLGGLDLQRGQLALSTELGRGNLGLDTQRLGESARQFDQSEATKRDQFGRQLTEDSRQFDLGHQLQQTLGLGNLNLDQLRVAEQAAQFGATLSENQRQSGMQDYRQGQSLGLQGTAQNTALMQSAAAILGQIASTPGLASILTPDKDGHLSAAGQTLTEILSRLTTGSLPGQTDLSASANPYAIPTGYGGYQSPALGGLTGHGYNGGGFGGSTGAPGGSPIYTGPKPTTAGSPIGGATQPLPGGTGSLPTYGGGAMQPYPGGLAFQRSSTGTGTGTGFGVGWNGSNVSTTLPTSSSPATSPQSSLSAAGAPSPAPNASASTLSSWLGYTPPSTSTSGIYYGPTGQPDANGWYGGRGGSTTTSNGGPALDKAIAQTMGMLHTTDNGKTWTDGTYAFGYDDWTNKLLGVNGNAAYTDESGVYHPGWAYGADGKPAYGGTETGDYAVTVPRPFYNGQVLLDPNGRPVNTFGMDRQAQDVYLAMDDYTRKTFGRAYGDTSGFTPQQNQQLLEYRNQLNKQLGLA